MDADARLGATVAPPDAPRPTPHAHEPAPTSLPLPAPPRALPHPQLSFDPFRPYRGLLRRFFVVTRHVYGLLAGGAIAYVRSLPPERRRGLRSLGPRLVALLLTPFVDRALRRLPFAQQMRRRLEILGPTYVKLGQILAIREDLLPSSITRELQTLFDRLPAIPFAQVRAIVEESLGAPTALLFARIEEEPLGSASIAQAHRAETLGGEDVVVKVIKPGIAEMIELDLRLLNMVGVFLEWIIPRYQPRQIIREFSAYTEREVDYGFEADNAETFAANFRNLPDVVFPRIHRELSSRNVLTMEFLDGFKPGSARTAALEPAQRDRAIDLGAAAIVRMLYQDGFFHADLHAGNLLILPPAADAPDGPVRVGFIDLGMVGRFEERTRRRMLFYFHSLVMGDVEGAARHLTDMATFGKGGDPHGFRRAVTDLSRRFMAMTLSGQFSIAQLILVSVGLGAKYRVFFPVEMTLMVKALVTFEGVGRALDPALDVAKLSRRHVARVYRRQFDPKLVLRDALRGAPELVDMATRLPQLLSMGFTRAEEILSQRAPGNPLAGVRSAILAAACIVGGVIAMIQGGAPLLWVTLFLLALVLSLFGR
ncbi:MAG TPA: AarF/UbiB family protein [Gemmatimonadaceae bacterium]|nr:AarF/UbiB family protein [Gemmatimonadaceae bacterium]